MRSVQVVAAGADHDRPGPTSAPDAGLSVGPSALAAHLVCDAVPEHIIRVSVLRLPAFGDVGAFRLARCLPRMRALRHLQISDCSMGPAACIAIGTGLASVARPLASLCLDYNEIGTAGLRHLNRCNALGAVEDVSLAFCGLVDVSLLASVLAGPSACIRRLDLSGNRIASIGAIAISAGLASNTTLERIDLSCTAMGAYAARTLHDVVGRRTPANSLTVIADGNNLVSIGNPTRLIPSWPVPPCDYTT
ncbi:hypothetical protein PBRA_002989 [Plasmodiophora brassicae]|uniref:Uncharacterized protein n=1 Tax=Plasmodiophora brassicae TaxID=37360 RepID=A0A0G4J796_PLABS|nr:hypothetical protein PBRA_002989 [Plasmodiophora brassicae]